MSVSECRVCLGAHNAEIHRATESVHSWLKRRMDIVLKPPPVIAPKSAPQFRPPLGSIRQLLSPAARRKAARK